MHGVTVRGKWPQSKQEIRQALKEDPRSVKIIPSSVHAEYSGPLPDLPLRAKITFAAPDFQADRRFFGTIRWRFGKLVCD